MTFLRSLRLVLPLLLLAPPLPAQQLAVPIVKDCVDDQAACYAAATVMGLDPQGDGFLAVRRGPGTDHAMIDKLFNGDVVRVITRRGKWYGVEYGQGRKGWVYGKWLGNWAG